MIGQRPHERAPVLAERLAGLFSRHRGKKATVLVPISSDGQNALAKTGKLKAKSKVVSQDGAGTQRTRTRSILLKLKK